MELKNNVWTFLVVTAAFWLSSAQGQQDLAFTSPNLVPVVSGAGLSHYTVGDNVTISWVTPFKMTKLFVYQLRDNNHNWAWDILARMFIFLSELYGRS